MISSGAVELRSNTKQFPLIRILEFPRKKGDGRNTNLPEIYPLTEDESEVVNFFLESFTLNVAFGQQFGFL